MNSEEVTIIGAGPGGIAAAIQLKRWGIMPLLLEKDHIGGILINANLVENYPGFPDGIAGTELVKLFGSQMERIGVKPEFEMVEKLNWDGAFKIRTNAREFGSKIVIVASGTSPKRWGAFKIPEDFRKRVFYEIHPIKDIRGKRILVVGAGDAAFDYALHLSPENEVSIWNRGDIPKCLPLLWERTQQSPSIGYRANTVLTGISYANGGMNCRAQSPQGDWELEVNYVIFAIGRLPEVTFVSDELTAIGPRLESEGLLYYIGDVKNDIYRQTSIAVGDGVKAAMRICRIIEGSE